MPEVVRVARARGLGPIEHVNSEPTPGFTPIVFHRGRIRPDNFIAFFLLQELKILVSAVKP
jgi:hypothetical protein